MDQFIYTQQVNHQFFVPIVYMERRTIILVGYGWASYGFLQYIDHSKYKVRVISKCDRFVYTPFLAKNINNDQNLEIPIRTQFPDLDFQLSEITNIDIQHKRVVTNNGQTHEGDILILAHGAQVNTFNIPGVQEYAHFLKTNQDAISIKDKIRRLEKNSVIVVIGCGFTGTELVGSLIDYDRFRVVAVDGLPRPLPMFDESLSNKAMQLWKENRVQMYFQNFVTKIDAKHIHLKNESISIPYDFAIWCGGIKIHPLSEQINRQTHQTESRGIPTNRFLDIIGAPTNCYAMGDCAFTGNPPTAQVAYQQGFHLAHSLNHDKRSEFVFKNKGQIGYIGKGQSVYQGNYFKGGGRLVGLANNAIHIYHFCTLLKPIHWTL